MITLFPEWISADEYAAKHKVKVRTIHDRVRRGELGYEKICGSKLFFDRDEWNKIKDTPRPIF